MANIKIVSLTSIKSKFVSLPEPVRIGIGLGAGFAVTLSLVILVMIVGFGYMAKVHADLEHMAQVSNVKADLAHTMKYAQRDRAVSLYTLALVSDPFEKDHELQHFNLKGAEFWRAWEKFQNMPLNAQERVPGARPRGTTPRADDRDPRYRPPSEDMIGQKFGEYSPTRTYYGHSADKKAKRK